MPVQFGGAGVNPSAFASTPTGVTLNGGETWAIPAGRWSVKVGKYTTVQEFDPVSGFYRGIGAGTTNGVLDVFFSDGSNYRLANLTGCAAGALITNAGTGYTSAPTVTASSGSSIWRAIVGGAVSTTVTIANGGSGYTYPPTVTFAPPPTGGIQASGYATISAGAVASIVVTDQGAGYPSAPMITLTNDPRELNPQATTVTYGTGASALASITGAQTITGLVCIDPGLPVTVNAATAVPTLAFSGGGGSAAAATWIGCLSITAYAVSLTTAGSGYIAPILVSGFGGFPATAAAYVNQTTQSNLVKGRSAQIVGAVSGTALTATGQVVSDGGIYPGAPTMYVLSSGLVVATGAVNAVFLTPTMGAQVDVSLIFPT
jgi:hypothetical protein